jgi:hypothetical protein
MAKRPAANQNSKVWLTRMLRTFRVIMTHGEAFQDDAVNAIMALTALMVPSPLSLSVALPIGSAIYHDHFVERLTAVAHFFDSWAFPRSSQDFH